MKVSLILPTLNRTDDLAVFLDSLLEQTYKDFELIVVDQNEGNEVFEIVKDYEEDFKIKYVKSDEKGLSLNRNRGLILMKGEIVGFPDDDCEYSPDTLEKVVESCKVRGTDAASNLLPKASFLAICPVFLFIRSARIYAYELPGTL